MKTGTTSLELKAKKLWLKVLKKYAKGKVAKAKKLEAKILELELEIFAEIHGYQKKTGLEDVK